MNTPGFSDREILTLLNEDIEKAAAALLEQYSGLLWSVCSKRLSDPEDIKECVNSSFGDFCLNFSRYDPEKSSLRTYLCGIADLKALELYRKNSARLRAQQAYEKQLDTAAVLPVEQSELEEALEQIEPVDAQIIRMKYYDGLTYPEIAQSLNLKPETVKKRGQRSLSKLKLILLGLIIALLLAGCAYIAHRYFRFAAGMGIFTENDAPVYQLAHTPEPYHVNDAILYIQNAVYHRGELDVTMRFICGESYDFDSANTISGFNINQSIFFQNVYIPRAIYISEEAGYSIIEADETNQGKLNEVVYHFEGEATPDKDGTIQCKLELHFNQTYIDNRLKLDYVQASEKQITFFSQEFQTDTLTFQLTLKELEGTESITDFGTVEDLGETTLLVCPGYEEEGWVKLPFYTLSLPEKLELSPILCTYYEQYPGYEGYSISDIYLEGADGARYPLIYVEAPDAYVNSSEYRLYFRDVPPGEYTLQIPRVLYVGQTGERLSLMLPAENGESRIYEKTVQFPSGGAVELRGITLEKTKTEINFGCGEYGTEGESYKEVHDLQDSFIYHLDQSLSGGNGNCSLIGYTSMCTYYHRVGDAQMEIRIDPFICDRLGASNPFGVISYNAYSQLHMSAPEFAFLTMANPVYLDDQAYSFRVTVR